MTHHDLPRVVHIVHYMAIVPVKVPSKVLISYTNRFFASLDLQQLINVKEELLYRISIIGLGLGRGSLLV
jgi:hypothetical protein